MKRYARGAALIVCLMLVTALSALALGAAADITIDLAMTRNFSLSRAAFAAAASGIELGLASGPFSVEQSADLGLALGAASEYSVTASVRFADVTEIPGGGFSMGMSQRGIVAYHFEVEAIALGPRRARSAQRQGFYVLGPRSTEVR
jgi:hypothetical protein